ncbi:MAG: hypothetical protein ACC707_07870 [Thiohalomonadales bacterium]
MALIKITINPWRTLFSVCFSVKIVITIIGLSLTNYAHAWVYSEHRDIAIQAVQNLSSEYRAEFDLLWAISRNGFEQQLCESVAESAQEQSANCIDWAAFSAIAGDHSCSSKEMLDTILKEKWLIEIADISARLKSELAIIPVDKYSNKQGASDISEAIINNIDKQENRAKRLNALRTADTQLLVADSKYAIRAGSNTAHFLIARPSSKTSASDYADLALSPGSEINAVGVYSWYHIKALQKAARLANEPTLTEKQRRTITRSMLADEGFALHFLEDVFSSGHVAGTWGEVSQRLGTHNYYNQHGLEVYTWNRDVLPVVLMGDAHMRQQDRILAAATITTSLKQIIDFSLGKNVTPADMPSTSVNPPDFNVCTHNEFPQWDIGNEYDPLLAKALVHTPIPGLGDGYGSLPRFRSEVGPFIGLAGSLDLRVVDNGYLDFQTQKGYINGLDLSFRAGFGMNGVMNESGDGLVYFSLGFRSDSASSNKITDSLQATQAGSISAAIPARTSLAFRIRMPFYLFPADLVLLSPLYFFNKTAYTNMAVTAGNGGLIPWQQGIATSAGRFQFVLGREIGVTLYGRNNTDEIIIPSDSEATSFSISQFKSIFYDFPILEYRPYRSFSLNQSSSVIIQLFSSADVPKNNKTIATNGISTSLNTVWSFGLRLVFDWRHY